MNVSTEKTENENNKCTHRELKQKTNKTQRSKVHKAAHTRMYGKKMDSRDTSK